MLVRCCAPPAGRRASPGTTSPRSRAQVRRRIGVALQEAALDLLMTGRELMELQATLHGIPPKPVRGRGDELIERVGWRTPPTGASAPTPAACGAASTSRWR